MTTILKCHVTLWVGSPHPKSAARFGVRRPASQPARFGVNRPASQPARFGVHRPNGTNGASSISSNSNSNAEVPVPRFTNGHLFVVVKLISFLSFIMKCLVLDSFNYSAS